MKTVIEMAREIADPEKVDPWDEKSGLCVLTKAELERLVEFVRADEREACEALHDHEDVLAPVGNSAWGEAYQEGWGQGAAAYRDAIRARSNT